MNSPAETNTETVKTMIANGLIGRYDVIRQYIADAYHCHLPAGLAYGGDYYGWDGYTTVFNHIVEFFSDVAFGPNEYIANDQKVVVLSRLKGTLCKSGKTIDQPLIEVWTFDKGMVIDIEAYYFDTKEISDLNDS